MNISNLTSLNSTSAALGKTGGGREYAKTAIRGDSLPAEVIDVQLPSLPNSQRDKSSQSTVSTEELRGLVSQANDSNLTRRSNLKFTVADGTDMVVVRIEDAKTGELIRQIPSEQMVAVARALKEHSQGMILAERA